MSMTPPYPPPKAPIFEDNLAFNSVIADLPGPNTSDNKPVCPPLAPVLADNLHEVCQDSLGALGGPLAWLPKQLGEEGERSSPVRKHIHFEEPDFENWCEEDGSASDVEYEEEEDEVLFAESPRKDYGWDVQSIGRCKEKKSLKTSLLIMLCIAQCLVAIPLAVRFLPGRELPRPAFPSSKVATAPAFTKPRCLRAACPLSPLLPSQPLPTSGSEGELRLTFEERVLGVRRCPGTSFLTMNRPQTVRQHTTLGPGMKIWGIVATVQDIVSISVCVAFAWWVYFGGLNRYCLGG